jgi:SpoIIAA-like
MIEHTLDSAHSILYVRPKSKLEQGDFVQLAKTVDPHIEEKGDLAGLIIEVTSFPGWESLGAMASHFRFVRDHHKHIKKIGVVTDSPWGMSLSIWRHTLWQPRSDISLRENLKRQNNGL